MFSLILEPSSCESSPRCRRRVPWCIGFIAQDEGRKRRSHTPNDATPGWYNEFPPTYSSQNRMDSVETILYQLGVVSGYATSIITDSEDNEEYYFFDGE